MRKHLYLITEHRDEDMVGNVKMLDRPLTVPEKNEQGASSVANFVGESGDFDGFETVGKIVGLGYADFEGEGDYQERIGDVVQQKLTDVDTEWLEKAGIDPVEVRA